MCSRLGVGSALSFELKFALELELENHVYPLLLQASKVRFAFGLADVQTESTVVVKVHVTPSVRGFNPTYGLKGASKTLQIAAVAAGTYRLTYNGAGTEYITYTPSLAAVSSSNANAVAIEQALNSLSTIIPGFVRVTITGA